ncbi:hypothetical protein [Streptomyces sp. SolWspMP-sol7th]|uniref:hypothetical protein n=1 Tax=Streptomyces sp. SolWspMP-sol7th TaxID=1839776 RepID=UPI0015860E07|nr:hypothetical protein [Streptomyces sp. SolWspMP-sol7th]
MDLDDGRRNATANTSGTVDQLLVGLRVDPKCWVARLRGTYPAVLGPPPPARTPTG